MTDVPNYLQAHADTCSSDPAAAARAWFGQAKFGLFLHYGLYSLLGRHEWVQLREKIRPGEYAHLAHHFDARHFDAEAICDLAEEASMRYVNLTTRHHDGFCLWDSRTSSFTTTRAAACERDLVAELAEACDRRGLGLCLYYSHGRDWKHPHAPSNETHGGHARPEYEPAEPAYAVGTAHNLQHYVDFVTDQVTELLTDYGPIAAIWLDGIATPLQPKDENGERIKDFDPHTDGDPFQCQALYDHIHQLQPQCLVSYKNGYLGTEDFYAPEHEASNRFGESFDEALGEVCTSISGGWGYTADADDKKDVDQAWADLTAAGEANCNLLLNTGPLPDGSIHPDEAEILRTIGRRIKEEGFPGRG